MVGYEWNPASSTGLKHLESELVYLAGMCAASLIKKDLQLPPTSGRSLGISYNMRTKSNCVQIVGKLVGIVNSQLIDEIRVGATVVAETLLPLGRIQSLVFFVL